MPGCKLGVIRGISSWHGQSGTGDMYPADRFCPWLIKNKATFDTVLP